MTRLAEIQGHIGSMDELQDIVGAMRSLAGMRVQEAQRALPGIRHYAQSLAGSVGAALALLPEPAAETIGGGRALILYTAEHGFVGGFNERLLAALEAASAPGDSIFVLGSRGASRVYERGREPDWSRPMASRPAGVPGMVDALAGEIYARIARRELARVEVVFARFVQGGEPAVQRHALLPLDPASLGAARRGSAPLHNLQPVVLLERLLAEYVFARLTEAAVESIASENAARFAAMEAAHDNVTKKLDELRQEARQARQSEITTELLDLVAGAGLLAPG
jgi:F-type H+-transporting ATPase subunit gamma